MYKQDEDMHKRFERWYSWRDLADPPLTRKNNGTGEYEHGIVQAMYAAYRAGYKRCLKELKKNILGNYFS